MIKNKLIYLFSFLILLTFFVLPVEAKEDLKGKILLQVESHGEAWYVLPDSLERVYLGKPDNAFSVMRDYGLGIKSSLLDKYLETSFPEKLSGKIVLDVERNGEAYYVYPSDLKGYYLGRPDNAFSIMRNLGLGISNKDLDSVFLKSSGQQNNDAENEEPKQEMSDKDITRDDDKTLILGDETKLVPYITDLVTFLSEVDNAYILIKYLNTYFTLKSDNQDLIAQNYEFFYQLKEGDKYDFATFINYVLGYKGYQAGALRYQYEKDGVKGEDIVIVFRDNNLPKYIAFIEDGLIILEHGWSFKDVIENEQLRLDISVSQYAYFEGGTYDYSEPVSPYKWINLK